MVEQIEFSHELLAAHVSQKLVLGQMASTNELVKKIRSLRDENSVLRKKMHSLKESARAVRNMYEEQSKNNDALSKKVNDLNAEIEHMRKRNMELENSSTNAQLTYNQIIAEMEKKISDCTFSTITKGLNGKERNMSLKNSTVLKDYLKCVQSLNAQHSVAMTGQSGKDKRKPASKIKTPDLKRSPVRELEFIDPGPSNEVVEIPLSKSFVEKSTMTDIVTYVSRASLTDKIPTSNRSTSTKIPTTHRGTLTKISVAHKGTSITIKTANQSTFTEHQDLKTLDQDVNEILKKMVISVPRLVSPIKSLPKICDNPTHSKKPKLDVTEITVSFVDLDSTKQPKSDITESILPLPVYKKPKLDAIEPSVSLNMVQSSVEKDAPPKIDRLPTSYADLCFDNTERPIYKPTTLASKNSQATDIFPNTSMLFKVLNHYSRTNRRYFNKDLTVSKQNTKFKLIVKKLISTYVSTDKFTDETTSALVDKLKKYDSIVIIDTIFDIIQSHQQTSNIVQIFTSLSNALNRNLDSFVLRFIDFLEHKIFTLKPNNFEMGVVINLVQLHVGLSNIEFKIENRQKVVLFIYKLFYYYNKSSYLIATEVLKILPDSLPKYNGSQNSYHENPIISSLIYLMLAHRNVKRTYKSPYHHSQDHNIRHLIMQTYEYPELFTLNQLLSQYILNIATNRLFNINYALILISKRQGYKWAVESLIKPYLVPLLDSYLIQSKTTNEHDDQIVCCMDTISAILKTYQLSVDITYFIQLYMTIIYSTSKKHIQEAAVASLLRFARFGPQILFRNLINWNSEGEINEELLLMFASFVNRRPLKYWKRLYQKSLE